MSLKVGDIVVFRLKGKIDQTHPSHPNTYYGLYHHYTVYVEIGETVDDMPTFIGPHNYVRTRITEVNDEERYAVGNVEARGSKNWCQKTELRRKQIGSPFR